MARVKFAEAHRRSCLYVGVGNPEVVIPDPVAPPQVDHHGDAEAVREIKAERPKRFGARKTYVRALGIAPMMSVAGAREKATAMLARVNSGKDPAGYENTLGDAWEQVRARSDLKPRTLKVYAATYNRCLSQWASTPLKTLSDNPVMSEELHNKLTDERGPSEANHALHL